MQLTPDEVLIVENRAGVAVLTLNRPAVRNAIDERLRVKLASAMAELGSDPDVRVLVLTGAGSRAFCAGMDLREFAAAPVSMIDRREQRRIRPDPFAAFPKPTIAAVNGAAFGAGLELMLQCDIAIAAASATFALPEVRRGLIPGWGGTQRLARRIGQGRALELILTGRTITAELGLQYGLVQRIVGDEELLPAAESLGREMLANAPIAIQLARDAIRRGLDMPLAQALRLEDDLVGIAMATEDAREGALAFAQKRPPHWKGQ
jgi:enoyl-CoA hydratase/carnithine racemase